LWWRGGRAFFTASSKRKNEYIPWEKKGRGKMFNHSLQKCVGPRGWPRARDCGGEGGEPRPKLNLEKFIYTLGKNVRARDCGGEPPSQPHQRGKINIHLGKNQKTVGIL
jgi:hypothetical protein